VKRLLAITIFMTLALALAYSVVGVKDASADAILAPSFRTDGSFITFVTVVNKSSNTQLHWMYRYDDPSTPTVNECFHADGFSKTTQNDMFTVDISDTVNGGAPVPDALDTTSTSYNIGSGWLGYLTIYAFTGTYGTGTEVPTAQGTINSEIVIANLATGELYSYKASNDPAGIDEGDFAFTGDITWTVNGVTNPGYATAIWHPTAAVATQWYILPVDDDLAFGSDLIKVSLGNVEGAPGFFYDINENPWSATSGKEFNCFAFLKLSDLIAPASLVKTALGGWARVVWVDEGGSTEVSSILVYKLETTTALTGATQSAFTSQNRVDW